MVNFEPDQAEKLAEIGTKLKRIREEKGLSLEQISAKTMIQVRALQAIENAQVELLPEPVYTQGFIRRFAEALDLDGAQLASALPIHPPRPLGQPEHRKDFYSPQLRPVHLYLVYLALIVAAVTGLSYLNRRSQMPVNSSVPSLSPTSSPGGAASPAATRPSPDTSPASSPTSPQPATISPTANNQPLDVNVSLEADSWVEVIADGQTVFEGTLTAGTQRRWSAQDSLTVYAGNAGAVLVQLNNEPPKPVGAAGAVESITFEAGVNTSSPSDSADPASSPEPTDTLR